MSNEFRIRITIQSKVLNAQNKISEPILAEFPKDFSRYSADSKPFNIGLTACLLARDLLGKIRQIKNFRRSGFVLRYYFNNKCKYEFDPREKDSQKHESFRMNTDSNFAFSIAALMIKSFDIQFLRQLTQNPNIRHRCSYS